VEVKIGVQNVAREIVLDSAQSADEIAALVDTAVAAGGVLRLTDTGGRTVVVPTSVLGYVDAGGAADRATSEQREGKQPVPDRRAPAAHCDFSKMKVGLRCSK